MDDNELIENSTEETETNETGTENTETNETEIELTDMEEILEDLKIELDIAIDDTKSIARLNLLIKHAINKVVNRRYPLKEKITEKDRSDAIAKYRTVIYNAVLYAYNKTGADFQSSHTEGEITRSWINEEELYFEVTPLVKLL